MAARTSIAPGGEALGDATPRPRGDDAAAGRFAFSRRIRLAGIGYVVVTAPLCGLLLAPPRGDARAYLEALMIVSAVYAAPGMVVAVAASRRVAPGERLVWQMWAGGFALGCLSAVYLQLGLVTDWDRIRAGTPYSTAGALVALFVANVLVTRRRSGQRAALVDVVDLLMATIAAVMPVALFVAEAVVTSEHAWFTVSATLWVVLACHGTFLALVLGSRLPPEERITANIGVALGVLTALSAAGGVVLGVRDFALSPEPFLAMHALCVGTGMLFFLWSVRRPKHGLERLPIKAQVRRRSLISLLVLAAGPVIFAVAWWRREHDWVIVAAAVTGLVLLLASSARHLLAGRETARLYGAVERAADERGALLADVMAHVDADRHRVAAHLHSQAVSLYTAMVSFTGALDEPVPAPQPSAVGIAAERMRSDLARRVDELRQVALAVEPLPGAEADDARRLAAPIRAYLENLYGDGPRPELVVAVDDDVTLDWTTETIVLRVVQEATHNVRRHAGADVVRVSIGTTAGVLVAEVTDDGVGFDPAARGRGIDTMRAMVGFAGGELDVVSAPGRGTRVRATVVFAPRSGGQRPRLRLVRGG